MMKSNRIGAVIFLAFGLVFTLIGIGLAVFASAALNREGDRIAALPVISGTQLSSASPNTDILLEGVISERNPQLNGDFVAFDRELYMGVDDQDDPIWSLQQRQRPALLLDADGALVQTTANYAVSGYHQIIDPGLQDARKTRQTERIFGLVRGREVTVLGQVRTGSEGPEINATTIYAGNRDQFIATQYIGSQVTFWVGFGFGLFGLVFGGIGVWWWIKL